MDKIVVNPVFRQDVDGRLFKEKVSNSNLQDTLLFNDLYTRLSIVKGDLALFPNLGLKQHLFNFGFVDESDIAINISKFESDLESQLNRECAVDYSLDRDNKEVAITFGVQGLKYPISFKYMQVQNSIKVIDYKFEEL